MDTQEKFTAAMQRIADDRDLDLVVDLAWGNRGWFSFQPRAAFEPVLRFAFDFRPDGSSFRSGGPEPGPLGHDPRGGRWGGVRGGGHELVIARVKALLDGGPDTVRIVVLPDGETWGALEGSRVCEVPAWFEAEHIGAALAAGALDGRGLR